VTSASPPSGQQQAPDDQGSPRDHLANERTYLAWLRTSLALVGVGLLVARFRVEGAAPGTSLIALGFAAIGLLAIPFATWRYYAVRTMIERGTFTPLGTMLLVMSIGAMAIGAAVVLHLLQQVGR
jgi:putative membrane protein